jgi:hypothetical protein
MRIVRVSGYGCLRVLLAAIRDRQRHGKQAVGLPVNCLSPRIHRWLG